MKASFNEAGTGIISCIITDLQEINTFYQCRGADTDLCAFRNHQLLRNNDLAELVKNLHTELSLLIHL